MAIALLSQYIPELLSDNYEQPFLRELLDKNPLQLFVLAVLFAPIIEEMMFRTLIQPSHSDIILLLCSWPVFYLNSYLPQDVNWVLKLLFVGVFLFVLFYILRELIPPIKTARLRAFLDKNQIPVLVMSSLIFGLVHINNYVEDFMINVALIALIIPRVLAGLMMGLVKIKNKHLGWSIGLHAINNGVVIIILIIAKTNA